MIKKLLILMLFASLICEAQTPKTNPTNSPNSAEIPYSGKSDVAKKLNFNGKVNLNSIVVYPNPVVDRSKVTYNLNNDKDNFFTVYSLLGTKVYEKQLNTKKGEFYLDVSQFSPGVYYYALKSQGEVIETKKMVVK